MPGRAGADVEIVVADHVVAGGNLFLVAVEVLALTGVALVPGSGGCIAGDYDQRVSLLACEVNLRYK